MNLKGFFVATLSSALDLGIANADDVLRHITPEVLSQHLPRPLWARLLTACVGAPRVDSQLVVETIGVPNLCEHVPAPIIWGCIEEIAARALGGQMAILTRPAKSISSARPSTPATGVPARTTPAGGVPATASSSTRAPLATPPPPVAKPTPPSSPAPKGPNIPSLGTQAAADAAIADLDVDEDSVIAPPTRARTATGQRFRQSSTGIGRLANNQRRPQAQAAPPASGVHDVPTSPPRARRGHTEGDFDLETEVGNRDDWKSALAVEDEQLVDWTASEETVTHTDDFSSGRKR